MAVEWTDLDTSAGALIRSGAGIFSIVLGIVILSARPRQAFNTAFALVLVLNGINYGVYALMGGYSHFPVRELVIPGHVVTTTCSLLQVALLLWLGWALLRTVPRRRAVAAVAGVVALVVVAATPAMRLVDDFEPRIEEYGSVAGDQAAIVDDVAYSAFLAASLAFATCIMARSGQEPLAGRTRGRLLLAAGVLMEPANWIGIGVYYGATLQEGLVTHVAFVLACLAILMTCLGFLAMRLAGKAVGMFPVVLSLGLLANAAAEVVVFAANDAFDHGLGGIMQVLGLAAIAFAVLRMDALGLQLPKLRNRAGSLAAVGLAALFITAQVAQNFLSDELGLLSGGIVAGAAVFAAYPLQKAAERAVERRPGTATAAERYRRLVETAWTDGKLGANERLLLAESRRQLGLDADTALGIDDEVARRHAERARGRA